MTRFRSLLAAGIATALCASFHPAAAQDAPRSQAGGVRQSVAGTEVEIVYRRPVARGRALFGALVPWGRIWTPSADSAARLTVSRPVEVNGQPLPAGSYGVWAIPDSTSWTLVFSRAASAVLQLRWGTTVVPLTLRARPGGTR